MLTEDVQLAIVKEMDIPELFSIKQTSSYWNSLGYKNELWKNIGSHIGEQLTPPFLAEPSCFIMVKSKIMHIYHQFYEKYAPFFAPIGIPRIEEVNEMKRQMRADDIIEISEVIHAPRQGYLDLLFTTTTRRYIFGPNVEHVESEAARFCEFVQKNPLHYDHITRLCLKKKRLTSLPDVLLLFNNLREIDVRDNPYLEISQEMLQAFTKRKITILRQSVS